MSRRFAGDQATRGKLTYCVACKDFTETIIIRNPNLLLVFKSRSRLCRICAKPKAETELEE